jgi:hypothetical protein
MDNRSIILVDVTGNLNKLNKDLQGKNKLITDVYDNIKAFKVKLWLWENELKLYNLVYFPHLKSLDVNLTRRIQEYFQSILLLREEFDERKLLSCALPLKADIEKAPDNYTRN